MFHCLLIIIIIYYYQQPSTFNSFLTQSKKKNNKVPFKPTLNHYDLRRTPLTVGWLMPNGLFKPQKLKRKRLQNSNTLPSILVLLIHLLLLWIQNTILHLHMLGICISPPPLHLRHIHSTHILHSSRSLHSRHDHHKQPPPLATPSASSCSSGSTFSAVRSLVSVFLSCKRKSISIFFSLYKMCHRFLQEKNPTDTPHHRH